MSYQALYRKWRPSSFDEVVGQDAIITTLKNQVRADRIGHAYLFCGTRGTGKTSVAKIFARAVNCPHAAEHGGSPCNSCEVCDAIRSGRAMNVFEIDAASNNGVDNIRDIRDQVEYPPVTGRFKVYIIDEVHMLSTGAFNALLKTLEEPPSYVIFILATTDPQKIPQTILSRCQRYDFKRMPKAVAAAHLKEIAAQEGLDIEESALSYIAEAGDGSMRDSLSLLDQCAAFHYGGHLSYEDVLEILGASDQSVYSRLFNHILSGEIESALTVVNDILSTGCDVSQLLNDFIWYLRNVLLAGSAASAEILDISEERLEMARNDAARCRRPELIAMLSSLSELGNRARYSGQKRVLLEVELIRLCTHAGQAGESSVPFEGSAVRSAGQNRAIPGSAIPTTPDAGASAGSYTPGRARNMPTPGSQMPHESGERTSAENMKSSPETAMQKFGGTDDPFSPGTGSGTFDQGSKPASYGDRDHTSTDESRTAAQNAAVDRIRRALQEVNGRASDKEPNDGSLRDSAPSAEHYDAGRPSGAFGRTEDHTPAMRAGLPPAADALIPTEALPWDADPDETAQTQPRREPMSAHITVDIRERGSTASPSRETGAGSLSVSSDKKFAEDTAYAAAMPAANMGAGSASDRADQDNSDATEHTDRTENAESTAVDSVPGTVPPVSSSDLLTLLRENWPSFLGELSPSNRPLFAGVVLKEEKNSIVLLFKNRINYTLAARNTEENGVLRLRQLASERFGQKVNFLARIAKPGEIEVRDDRLTDEELARINFPITFE